MTRYHAPPGCPPQRHLESLIRRYLARTPVDPERAVSVRIERLPDGAWQMRVALPSERLGVLRERVLTSERSCTELIQAAAVIIAIVIEGNEEERALDSDGHRAATDSAGKAAPEADEREPLRRDPEPIPALIERDGVSAPSLSFAVRLLPVLDVGSFPRPELGGKLAAALRFGQLGATLGGLLLLTQEQRFDGLPDAGADYFLWLGSASFDYRPFETGAVELWLSLGAEAGLLRAEAVRLDAGRSRSTPWIAATFGTSLVLAPSSWWAVVLEPELAVPARRPSFVVAGYGTLHQPNALVFRGALGLELRF